MSNVPSSLFYDFTAPLNTLGSYGVISLGSYSAIQNGLVIGFNDRIENTNQLRIYFNKGLSVPLRMNWNYIVRWK